ncbi:hypothetical protein GOP47_0016257 [Adiantum capillus-veneris]|uniref:non-specific serine/threonine protein kinase n=1 Tax=Adiantum capillus-veneris TaxID=13818 RepID=A0A9D4ZBK7_ADICA|nr:hypothetical protein GOP47_0016257 [Adiantum capillus-veneris]
MFRKDVLRAHIIPSPAKAALFLLVFASSIHWSISISDSVEVRALRAIKASIGDVFNRLRNWEGEDPCGDSWTGVLCTDINGTSYVTELRLLNMNFTGTLAPDLGNLTQLTIMDFMWNNITGSIPPEVGYLRKLQLMLLSGNKLSGILSPEFGNLTALDRFQIDENNISGPIPSSYQFLNNLRHFHMNNNSLNGSIPPELGRLRMLAHLLFDNNKLTGEIPSEISNISALLIVQLDNNQFSGSIPASFQNFSRSNITKLSLRNCGLNGTIPDFSEIATLLYLDLSHNQLSGGLPPNLPQSLRTIDLSNNRLDGEIPASIYGLGRLELLLLQNNSLDGVIAADLLAHDPFTNAGSVYVMDFQSNNFTDLSPSALLSLPNVTLRLSGNPLCEASQNFSAYCTNSSGVGANVSIPLPTVPLPMGCSDATCDKSRNQELNYGLVDFGVCQCAYPLSVGYRLKSPSFAIYQPYQIALQNYLGLRLNLSDHQVNVSDFTWEPGPRLGVNLKLFPSNGSAQFNSSEVERLYNQFATFTIAGNRTFGPHEVLFFLMEFPYNSSLTNAAGSKTGLKGGAIAGIVLGGAAFTALVVVAVLLFVAKRRGLFAARRGRAARHHERLKVDGVKDFTFKEMTKATNNFDSSLQIGQGGYGKVYKAILADGLIVAIKRAEEGSLQGTKEFLTELQTLSRLHHRNLVDLVGFCDDEGEQMLIYEFMANGTLRDHLNSSSKAPLAFERRIQIALGAAKGILYLHTEADPPLFHRDIKATNILLDHKFGARVADFGLSKLAPVAEIEGDAGGYVSTVVKGTPGYLDPEYFLTHKLTDKSDVYSFGVVLLELLTGQQPITKGKNLVREVHMAYEAGMLLSTVDPRMGPYPAECLEPFMRLAFACCKDETDSRPSMAEVVRELEGIKRLLPPDATLSFETSVDTEPSSAKHHKGFITYNPYISSDIDGSNLMSGTIPSIVPR